MSLKHFLFLGVLGLFLAGCSTPAQPGATMLNSYTGALGADPIYVYVPDIVDAQDTSFLMIYYGYGPGTPDTWYPVADGDYLNYFYNVNFSTGDVGLFGFSVANGFSSADRFLIQVWGY